MSYQSTLLPDGHIQVASIDNGESALVSYYVATLSRSNSGPYCLTQTIGQALAHADSEFDESSLTQNSRSLTANEAIIWLERELTYARAGGDSPYNKQTLALNRDEIRRLLSGNPLQGWFYSAISHFVIARSRRSRAYEIRDGQIPHPKIFFTDQERDVFAKDDGTRVI